MSVVSTLRAAQRLLSKDGHWVKGYWGAFEEEDETYGGLVKREASPASRQATMFCSVGAVQHVLGLNKDGVFDFQAFEGKKKPSEAEIRAREEEYHTIIRLLDRTVEGKAFDMNGNPLSEDALEILNGGCSCSEENGWFCPQCELVDEVTTFESIMDFNDAEGTGLKDVLNAFAAAIKFAKANA